MDNILHGLNKAQREAVTSDAGVLQVLAPPGSGKTKTLTTRVAYFIAERHLLPWNIITCTFTKKSANEMKERIRNFIGDDLARKIKLGTFHSIAALYLRQYGQHIGLPKDFGIADTSDSKAILKRIIGKHRFTIDAGQALSRISGSKCKGIESDEFVRKTKDVEQQEFGQIFVMYEAELKASNLLDFDDIMLKCCFLLETHPQSVSNVEAVLIDEFQDTNTIQYKLMRLFAQKRDHITIVGDPDQSIYGFRHAEIANLHRMKKDWPDTITINLKENYRSSGAILNAAQKLIEQDESRPPKKLQATHTQGQRPILRKLASATAEARWLVEEIKRIRALSGHVLKHDDFAILLRSAALSRLIEAALGREGTPYRMVGGLKFFARVEVKLVVDYLRVIAQPSNSEAVERILNVPARGIGDATLKCLRESAATKGSTLWDLVLNFAQGKCKLDAEPSAKAKKGLSSFVDVILSGQKRLKLSSDAPTSLLDVVNMMIKKIDLRTFLRNKYENEFEAKWSNIEELLVQVEEASVPQRMQEMIEQDALPVIDDFEQRTATLDDALSIFLANIALSTSGEEKLGYDVEPVPQVTISTIHSAKGLEWPVVFVPACYNGSIPHSRSDDSDEERRLLYVAMTRAQAMLYLSCPVKDSQKQETAISSYLTQPGIGRYFEEHGPSMSHTSAQALATTLRRDLPSLSAFDEGRKTLERDEDNYWPLNGEEPPEELAKWNSAKAKDPLSSGPTATRSLMAAPTTMQQQPGFTSAAEAVASGMVSVQNKYEEHLEEARLRAIDKRMQQNKESAPRGRKRQIPGQGSIAGFFENKRRRPSSEDDHTPLPTAVKPGERRSGPAPLQDVSNLNLPSITTASSQLKVPTLTSYKPRTAPLRTQGPSKPATQDPAYMFLSSPPERPTHNENVQDFDTPEEPDDSSTTTVPQFRPASTFHTTSVQSLRPRPTIHGRRLGVRPSMNGWANRARK